MIIEYAGYFGNHLFQYSTACLFSDKFKFGIQNPFDNKITKFDNIHSLENFKNTIIVDDSNVEEIYNKTIIESNLVFKGFYQNRFIIDLFLKNKKKLFNTYVCDHKNDVFVHARLGDIYDSDLGKPITRYADLNYFKACLSGVNGGFISSDSSNSDFVQSLSKDFNLKIYFNSPEDTIIYGSTFSTKILSLGTFSWWIGFLGNNTKKVFCPDPNKHIKWHGDIFPFLDWIVK